MVLSLLLAHAVAAVVAPFLARAVGRWAFVVLAAVPAAAFAWAVLQTPRIAEGDAVTQVVPWVPRIGLEIALSVGTLQWLLMLVVTGVGALVLFYCRWYFSPEEKRVGAFAATFTGFAGAMLGLVVADDLLLLYVFWEATTVFSYLLIGHDPAKRAARAAGLQALMVTTFGGLAMLVGILVVGVEAGTYRVSEILADPPAGTAVTVAVGLILLGALSKSALFPLHFWLPGAMAAPTPVSAYLHAAAMVKAGVYLVALLAPAFATVPGWHLALLTLGTFTMLLGGWRSLRQYDIKLLLAYGTVSQLGFLMVVLSVGTRAAALAGAAMLLAHALFKAALFLTVGIVDHSAGTRDLRELSGVGRSMPLVAVAATVAGLSMAGLPPLAGFVAKEGIFGAFVDLTHDAGGIGLPAWAAWAVLVGIVVGSGLTAAYTARFLWGAFWTKPEVPVTDVHPVPPGFATGPLVLAALSAVVGVGGALETRLLRPYVEQFPAAAHEPYLALWHGPNPALALSLTSLALGAALFWARKPFAKVQAAVSLPVSAEGGYRRAIRAMDRAAVELTGLTQRGSVTVYLGVILWTVVALVGSTLLMSIEPVRNLVLWDRPAQAVVGAVVVVAALLTTRARHRLQAVVLAGITGYGTALLFVLHGAPDLGLTQVLVETVSLVIFVLVLRRLPKHFSGRALVRTRYWQVAVSTAVAVTVGWLMLRASGARELPPVSTDFPAAAYKLGGGRNIVNVTLVDIRAWDTMGEIAVVVAAATGVASLLYLEHRGSGVEAARRQKPPRQPASPAKAQHPPTPLDRPLWLRGSRGLPPESRSIVFEVVTRLIFHTVVVFSLFLLFSGHNNPGGGFAAGLMTGLALMVRYLAAGRAELDEAAPVHAGALMGTGLFLATGSGLAPLALGGTVLQSAVVDLHVPLLGDVHLVTSLFFDIGVYLVIVGLMLDVLRSLGSQVDRHLIADRRAVEHSRAEVGV